VAEPKMNKLGLAMLSADVMHNLADDDCDAPVERWQSREAVRADGGP
jgi:hypothetical protein